MANEAMPDRPGEPRDQPDPTEVMGVAGAAGAVPLSDPGVSTPGAAASAPGAAAQAPDPGPAADPGSAPDPGPAVGMVPPPPPPPPPGAVPPPGPAPSLPDLGRSSAGPRSGGRLGAAVQMGHGMTASQVASRLQLSAHAITVNDMVGAFGALLVFIGYFVAVVDVNGQGVSLASHGGFWAALVPIFAPVSGAALLVPPARRLAAVWLALAASATGIALGSRNLFPFGYAAGWWLCFFGGIGLCYAWVARTAPRTGEPDRR